MLIYQKLSELEQSMIPAHIMVHIAELWNADSASMFFCKIDKNAPSYNIQLIEINNVESYSLAHYFSFDLISEDYSYYSLPLEVIDSLYQLASRTINKSEI